MTFDELNIPDQVRQGIMKAGFTECTPIQALTLPEALIGNDIAAQAQTGTGKTAAFLITVFSRMLSTKPLGKGPSPRALIIAPTRELVVQIEDEAKLLGGQTDFRIVSVLGGMNYEKQKKDLAAGVDILVGTPGRLIDFLKQRLYSLKKTQFLVIDEADRMFDMGFISDLRFILKRMAPYHSRQSLLFSATLTYRVTELCYEHMNNPQVYKATPEQVTAERVEQELYHVSRSEKFGLLLSILKRESGGRYLVFCNTKAETEKVARYLNANGHAAEAITGDLSQNRRLRALKRFKEGSLPILLATDVASRGLHIEGVTHVINYDLPQDPENYVHRIGRTARAGKIGKAISLACEEYVFSLPDIERYIKEKISVMPLTDEMILTDYQRPPRVRKEAPHHKKSHSGKSRHGRTDARKGSSPRGKPSGKNRSGIQSNRASRD